MDIEKSSLNTRLNAIKDGDIFNEDDITAYAQMIEKTAFMPIVSMLDNKTRRELLTKRYNDEEVTPPAPFPQIYLDAVSMIDNSCHKDTSQMIVDPRIDISDRAWDIFSEIWSCFLSEFSRRQNPESFRKKGGKDISSAFPVFQIPLPAFFKAAGKCSSNEERKSRLQTIYKDTFRPFLEDNMDITDYVRWVLKYQPEQTGYLDPVSMTMLLTVVSQKHVITMDEATEKIYMIIVLPFLM